MLQYPHTKGVLPLCSFFMTGTGGRAPPPLATLSLRRSAAPGGGFWSSWMGRIGFWSTGSFPALRRGSRLFWATWCWWCRASFACLETQNAKKKISFTFIDALITFQAWKKTKKNSRDGLTVKTRLMQQIPNVINKTK